MSNLVPVSSFGPYGTSDDTSTWVSALASGEPLWVPPGISPVLTLNLPKNCYIKGARGLSILKSLPGGLPLLALSDTLNTCVTVEDIILDGDKANQTHGATFHRGVYFLNAFNDGGANDAAYINNSPFKMQFPAHRLKLIIHDFLNDGAYLIGSGGSSYYLRVYNCDGVGVRVNSYDNQFHDCDIGASGLQGWLFEANGSANVISGGKTWFSGSKKMTGQMANLYMGAAANVFGGHLLQDPFGSQIEIVYDTTLSSPMGGCNFSFTGVLNRHSEMVLDTAVTAEVMMVGSGCNMINTQALVEAIAPFPTFLIQNIASGSNAAGTNNDIHIQTSSYVVNDSYLNYIGGTLDGNLVNISPYRRSQNWLSDDSGNVTIGAQMAGTVTGVVFRGVTSPYPGGVVIIGQQNGGQLQSYSNTAQAAKGTLTATANFSNGETVSVAGVVYTFTSSSPALANQVHVGASTAASLANLHHAINRLGGVQGTDYGVPTLSNPSVTATDNGTNQVVVTARAPGAAGNALATSTTAAHASWGGSTLSLGANGTQTYTGILNWVQSGASYRPYLQGSARYANDAAAAAGGVAVQQEYLTTATPAPVAVRIA